MAIQNLPSQNRNIIFANENRLLSETQIPQKRLVKEAKN